MKRVLCLMIVVFLMVIIPCTGADVDPILLNEPNPNVFGCRNDIFIELTRQPMLSKVASGRMASGYYIVLRAEILFLVENEWIGIDKSSFMMKHTNEDGTQRLFPLDYAGSMIANLKDSLKTFADHYKFADLKHTNLFFDVEPYTQTGWSLVFRPTERGGKTPYCEVEIPIKVK